MFKNILLATDFSKHSEIARKVAISLARGEGKKLTVLNVFDPHKEMLDEGVFLSSELVEKAETKHIKEEYEKKMKEFVKPIKDEGVDFVTLVEEGKPAPTILKKAEELEADIIVIGSHSKRGFIDVSLGGVARYVGEHAPCAVLIATPSTKI